MREEPYITLCRNSKDLLPLREAYSDALTKIESRDLELVPEYQLGFGIDNIQNMGNFEEVDSFPEYLGRLSGFQKAELRIPVTEKGTRRTFNYCQPIGVEVRLPRKHLEYLYKDLNQLSDSLDVRMDYEGRADCLEEVYHDAKPSFTFFSPEENFYADVECDLQGFKASRVESEDSDNLIDVYRILEQNFVRPDRVVIPGEEDEWIICGDGYLDAQGMK